MSEILENAHDMATDLHVVGVIDAITMQLMDELCVPKKGSSTALDTHCIGSGTKDVRSGLNY